MPYMIKGSHHSKKSRNKMRIAWIKRKETFVPFFKLHPPSKKTIKRMRAAQKKRFRNPKELLAHSRRISAVTRLKYPKSFIHGGYVGIFEPKSPIGSRRIREHRHVIEKHLGIKLKKSWVVHHVNKIRNDNRIENLMVLVNNAAHSRIHGKGCQPFDIIFDGSKDRFICLKS